MLTPVARRVLAIPASQEHSKRLFMSADVITMRKHNSLGVNNVELPVPINMFLCGFVHLRTYVQILISGLTSKVKLVQ